MGRSKNARARKAGSGGKRDAAAGLPQLSQASGLLTLAEDQFSAGNLDEAHKAAQRALDIVKKVLKAKKANGKNYTVSLSALEHKGAVSMPGNNLDEDDEEDDEEDDDEAVNAPLLAPINLLAQINVELGNIDEARDLFLQAVDIDTDGQLPETIGGGAEKFLWLAQLSETGGKDSVQWFERGRAALQHSISRLTPDGVHTDSIDPALQEQQGKLARALCGIIEVYMTDLSWEADAEEKCEKLVAEAILAAPFSAETLQTLANIRLSQGRTDEAQKALRDSMAIWQEDPQETDKLDDHGSGTPDFPSRISLARLLMEAGMPKEALTVTERLLTEDDNSVEAWYLGGWCLFLLAEQHEGIKTGDASSGENADLQKRQLLDASRQWLRGSIELYEMHDYMDHRLKEHAEELIASLDQELGSEEEGEDDGADWVSDEEEAELNENDAVNGVAQDLAMSGI